MLYSNDCFLKDTCRTYKNNPQCECKSDNVFCEKLIRLDDLYSNSLLTDKQRIHVNLYPDADGTDEDEFTTLKCIENNIETFVNSGQSLYLYSLYPGNGKTSWSIRFIQAYFNHIWYTQLGCKALFINVPRFLIELKNNITQTSEYIQCIKNNIESVPLVVWDDIGTKCATEFEMENLYTYINHRIDCGLANIFTANISPNDIGKIIGERLASRIISPSTICQLKGMDKRGII